MPRVSPVQSDSSEAHIHVLVQWQVIYMLLSLSFVTHPSGSRRFFTLNRSKGGWSLRIIVLSIEQEWSHCWSLVIPSRRPDSPVFVGSLSSIIILHHEIRFISSFTVTQSRKSFLLIYLYELSKSQFVLIVVRSYSVILSSVICPTSQEDLRDGRQSGI